MKRLELMPTDENILTSLEEDIFKRNQDLGYFIQLLDSIEGPYSIAINGSWGSGKTFFVKQAKMVLDAYNKDFNMPEMKRFMIKGLIQFPKQKLKNQYCIYYDAWKNDSNLDPIYSLICSIVAGYEYFNKSGLEDKKYLIEVGISIIKNIIPYIPNSAIRTMLSILPLDKIKDALKNTNPLSNVKEHIELEEKIQEFLQNLSSEKEERLVIFVDELDRCRPDFAVQLLERIKHYFDLENITFVFSVNCEQLVHTIQKFYGENFDAGRYLGRFFDQVVPLPEAKLRKFYKIHDIDEMYFCDMTIKEFSKSYNFSIRDLVRYINMSQALVKRIKNTQLIQAAVYPDMEWLLSNCIIPVMIGINIFEPQNYNAFISGEREKEFVQFVGNMWYVDRIHKVVVTPDSKGCVKEYADTASELGAIYQALFGKENEGLEVSVGNYFFTDSVRTYVRSAGSLLSGISDFDSHS